MHGSGFCKPEGGGKGKKNWDLILFVFCRAEFRGEASPFHTGGFIKMSHQMQNKESKSAISTLAHLVFLVHC